MALQMKKNDNRTPSHPIRVGFMGEAGAQALAKMNGSKGFISHHASIATSGMTGGAPFENPIQITSYGSQADTLAAKNVYLMNCKLIGTNNSTNDQLHFENANRINLGSVDKFGEFFVGELIDKITISALGYVVGRDLITDPVFKGKSTVVVTLKSTDYDPLTKANVSWHTKHYIPPVRNMEKAQNLCQLGREVLLTGQIKDYDSNLFMWESEQVHAISICHGEITIQSTPSSRSGGGPSGGRIPLSLNRNPGSNVASTSSQRIESTAPQSIATDNSDPLYESLFGGNEAEVSGDESGSEVDSPLAEVTNSAGKRRRRN
ncbi:uncharacterized protein MELLADRAFT_84731 [Melampsora larici-populina 98AG31]|uniref:Uncharacterized protein n=1 Tax=Melampsora larici-populina (strain 98AG31 / pathotype 3-4-7) TaxID=747676 RepID=F4RG28_MELLP|nr:uncharacterized protein MELLADRAFT_84731 [Melampsora larici-populina 98AG31]EGG08615.1 hypothetical protein MELLADRAFT_84731 [Melampsora larici-populina 98AG31]